MVDSESGEVAFANEILRKGEDLVGYLNVRRGLVFLLADNSLRSVVAFHACLAADLPVAVLSSLTEPDVLAHLITQYEPSMVLAPPNWVGAANYSSVAADTWAATCLAPDIPGDLAVLLPTSGSTGSPRMVRLARAGVEHNARSIARSLAITALDRATLSLPHFYSFGMSILTSHACAGSTVVIPPSSTTLIEPAYWRSIGEHSVTFFAGVPQTYLMLRRLDFGTRYLQLVPSLRGLLQAGGRLGTEEILEFDEIMGRRKGEFFVMYGQTEAGPRICCLPPSDIHQKLGSVGLPIEGVRIQVLSPSGVVLETGETGEVMCSSNSVMLGYADSRKDLAHGDRMQGQLLTGDVGYLDKEGYLFLTGRIKRIAKVVGIRVSLDDVEQLASHLAPVAATEDSEAGIQIWTESRQCDTQSEERRLAAKLRIPVGFLRVFIIDRLPLLPNGKVDYLRLSGTGGLRDD